MSWIGKLNILKLWCNKGDNISSKASFVMVVCFGDITCEIGAKYRGTRVLDEDKKAILRGELESLRRTAKQLELVDGLSDEEKFYLLKKEVMRKNRDRFLPF